MRIPALLLCVAAVAGAQSFHHNQPAGRPSTVLAPGVERFENLTYARYGRRVLQLDLFVPEKTGVYPGMLVVHGGGWQNGDKTKFRAMCQQFALNGFTAACVGYRLSNEALFPAALQDLKAAVRWMRTNAKEYKIDRERIGAIGGSAGGHLVGMLATTAGIERFEGEGGNQDESSAIQAAIVMGGGMDYVTPLEENPDKDVPNMLVFFGASYRENPKIYAEASPVTHVGPKTPPFLFIDCEFDQPGERYATVRDKLDKLKIPNELIVTEGGKHGCWNSEPWFSPILRDSVAFLRETM